MKLEIGKKYRRQGSARVETVGGLVHENAALREPWVWTPNAWYEQATGKFIFTAYTDGMVTKGTYDEPNWRDLTIEVSPEEETRLRSFSESLQSMLSTVEENEEVIQEFLRGGMA